MSPVYHFTDADRMQPVYCIGCRAHIPDAVSKALRGLCPVCVAKIQSPQSSQIKAPQPLTAVQAPPLASTPAANFQSSQSLPTNGQCPRCNGNQVLDKPVYETNGTAVGLRSGGALVTLFGALTVCLGIGAVLLSIGIVLWIVGACIPMRRLASLSHQCHPCGFQWTSVASLGAPAASVQQAPKQSQDPSLIYDPRGWWAKRDLVEKLGMFVLPALLLIAFLVQTINDSYAQRNPSTSHRTANSAPQPAPMPAALTPYEQRQAEIERQRQAAEQRRQQEEAAKLAWIRNEERTRGPRPTPSAWDTVCPEVNAYLKATLKDYDSLKIVNGSDVVTYGTDAWCQRLKYRARNSFGGYVLEEKLFVLKNREVINVLDY